MNVYPKPIETIEKITPDSAGYRVLTIVNSEAEENGVKAALAFMDAFNEADDKKSESFINFPHARVGVNTKLVVSANPGDLHPSGFFDRFRKARGGWAHSCWDSRTVIQSNDTKVHLMVCFSRYRTDGSKIDTFPSIWIMTKQDGHWGIKMRSSYA